MQTIATFSIVAYDPLRKEWGVAVQSKFLAAAAVVSWAAAGAGAVATQARANMSYGPRGLDMLRNGLSAREVGERLVSGDAERQVRQLGIVDSQGEAWAHTGAECQAWAGHRVGRGYTCQGNILVPGTVEAMAEAFEAARGAGNELADWLMASLTAGQAAGGDSRGRQAAGLLVVKEGGSYGGTTDRYIDLRVDDHPEPIAKLAELLVMHRLFFGGNETADFVPLSDVTLALQGVLLTTGDYQGPAHGEFDDATCQALLALVSRENLEERWEADRERIDRLVVDYLLRRFASK